MTQLAVRTPSPAPGEETLTFEVTDVTGTLSLRAENVRKSTTAGLVTQALAARMELPGDVPWALRDDATSALLDDSRPVGDQLGPDSRVTVIPRTHLG